MRRSLAALVVIVAGLSACAASGSRDPAATAASDAPERSQRGFPLGDLRITSEGPRVLPLVVEIADTPEGLARGLMQVGSLPDDRGMAFLMPGVSTGGFWMKDTLIPLDIAFWDAGGRIVDILHMQPCRVPDAQCPIYRPQAAYVGALEVNLGLLERNGVRTGDAVELARRQATASFGLASTFTAPMRNPSTTNTRS